MMWGFGYSWGSMLLGMVGMLLWFVLLGLLLWALIRWITDRTPSSGLTMNSASAMEILQQRYARGEIDEATFARMRDQLSASGALPQPPFTAGR